MWQGIGTLSRSSDHICGKNLFLLFAFSYTCCLGYVGIAHSLESKWSLQSCASKSAGSFPLSVAY